MGLSRILVLTLTWRTCPLLSRKVSKIQPKGQEFCEVMSIMITILPVLRFCLIVFHFYLFCISGRYSLIHRFQKKKLFPSSSGINVFLLKMPRRQNRNSFHLKKMIGVKSSGSLASSETVVIGRSLSMASTSYIAVCRSSSSRVCCLRMEYKIFLRIQMIRSHTHP